jgi:ABC toxin N-terminal region/Neuraminidase-like domain/Salmonella virulence plasmid 28.1kDa A protein
MSANQGIALKIRVVDAQGNLRGGTVDVELKHRKLSDRSVQRGLDASREIIFSGLRRAPEGDYQVTVTPADVFEPKSQFITIPPSGFATLTFTVEKPRVVEPQPEVLFEVKGIVRTEDGAPLASARVRAEHDAAQHVVLGEDDTDATGGYVIKYSSKVVAGPISLRVSVVDEQSRPLRSSDTIRGPKPLEVVNLIVPRDDKRAATRALDGRVLMEYGRPADKLKLRIYRHGFGGARSLLGETTTGADGSYAFPYEFRGNGVSLEVRAVDAAGKEEPLSKVIHVLASEESKPVDLLAPTNLQPLAAEFRRLSTDLRPQVGELKALVNVKEDAERQDLTILNRETGWDARLIALAAQASKLSEETKGALAPEVLYGLFRAGLPSDKTQLAGVSAAEVEQALRKAKDAGVVELNDAQITDARNKFETFSVETRLAVQAPGSRASYDEMLKAAGLTSAARTKFAKVFLDHTGDDDELWEKAEQAGVTAPEIKVLQRQGQLAFLTLNNAELTTSIQTRLGDRGPAQLVRDDFYRADKWAAELRTAANNNPQRLAALIPPAYEGANAEERLTAYSEDMARKVRLSYPTHVVSRMVEQDAGDKLRLGEPRLAASRLLNNAADKNFKLGQTTVEKFVSENPDVLDGIAAGERAAAVRSAKTLQAVYQITPGDESLAVLLEHGLTSAYDVVATSREVFLERYGRFFPSPQQAELVYRKAQQVTSVTYNLFAIAKTLESQPPVYGLSAPTNEQETAKNELIKQFPTLESLFGSMDFCECEHCRSVLSPAAYLVDLLQFLDPEAEVWNNFLAHWQSTHNNEPYTTKYLNPYDALVQRRPDLPHTPLTCENTHTALPYIDVVNEILEYFVANDALEEAAARDTGEATTAELLAEPQYVIAEAYDKLQKARYPLGLPFDLWLENVRQFSDHFETPLWQVLEALRPTDDLFAPAQPYDRAAIFAEALGLAPAEYAIFTDPNPLPTWFRLYGYATVAQATTVNTDAATQQRIDLNSAKALARRLGVTYKELAAVVKTGFVNPKLSELGILHKLGVSAQDVFFYQTHRGLIGQNPASLSPGDYQRRQEVLAFETRLDALTDEFDAPGFDAKAWMDAALADNSFDRILVLADPAAGCNFDQTTLRYANGAAADGIAFLKLNLFVRLWRKLGWTIEETDRALQAFIPRNTPYETANLAARPLKTALVYLAHLKQLDARVGVGKQSRTKLLTLWSHIPTTGANPLYAQLFLTRSVLKTDIAFDNLFGNYLSQDGLEALAGSRTHEASRTNVAPADQLQPAAFAAHDRVAVTYDPLLNVQHLTYRGVLTDADKATLAALAPSPALAPLLDDVQAKGREYTLVKGHLLALRGALGLTADEINRILADAGADPETAALSLANVSLLYRYGLLAKALRLSIAELIALKQLSGLDPFKALPGGPLTSLAQDSPFTHTLRFVEAAAEVKASGLKIEDLEYLLRHRFDETGKYRTDGGGALALMKTLAEGIRAILAANAVPDDPGAMSEDTLRQRLGLVLPPDVVQTFLAMLNGTAEFTATRAGVPPADQLQPAAFAGEPSVTQLSYNPVRQEQKLTFRGVLFDPQKNALNATLPAPAPGDPHVPSPHLATLLDDVQAQARAFFDKHLKQGSNVPPATGFLVDADFALLFAPAPAGLDETQQQARLRQQRTRLTEAFLPFLQQRLIRQFIIQTMTAQTEADPPLVESLLTDERLLSVPAPAGGRQSLLNAFAAAGERGLTASFFASTDGTGAALTAQPFTFADAATGLKDKQGNALKPAGANSALFEGYLEVTTPGPYRFFVAFDRQNAEAELRFEHLAHLLPVPFLEGAAAADGAEIGDAADRFLELKPGLLYRFSLDLTDLGGGDARLLVQSEALPKESLARLTLYPEAIVGRADRALLLLRKATQLAQSLNLNERDVRYLLTHATDFGGLDLSKLPARADDDTPAGAQALFNQFLRLAGYARLKRDLAGGTDDLISIFETSDVKQAYALIAKLLRRDEATVEATAKTLSVAPSFTNELKLQRLWEALQVVERFGVPVTAVVNWTRIVGTSATAGQRFAIARDLKEAIKARFEPETWQRVAQLIFDRLRRRQRDALVAHVMHQHGFARVEQLYEYFLIDPGMEPVVQTSRVRLAIASVQLFIQRCLLNLEPKVHPSVVNAEQWEWMKRYRVWEANRKIFLFPENWLEPEFRDDKTHLFAELEGALLEGDVSNDLVEDAFLNYLKKLDELARLDIVGMHLENNPDPALRTLHVIGRTYSAPHQYFYRRYVHQTWTPWEPITAQVEGTHLAPVVWRSRLYLFWVTFTEKAKQKAAPTSIDPTKAVPVQQLETELEAQLHWSEYVKGEWHTRESGNPNPPDGQKLKGASVDPRSLRVYVTKRFESGEERGVYVSLGHPFNLAFYLEGRNSVPVRVPVRTAPAYAYSATLTDAASFQGSGPLDVTFQQSVRTGDGAPVVTWATQHVLQSGDGFNLLPCDNDITLGSDEVAKLIKPFFYQDQLHTLFAEPTVTERTIEEWKSWLNPPPLEREPRRPRLPEFEIIPEIPRRVLDPRDPVWNPPIDENSIIQPRETPDWLTNPTTGLLFGEELIGPGGRSGVFVLPSNVNVGEVAAEGPLVNVRTGGGVAESPAAVITVSGEALVRGGLTFTDGGLNAVDEGGVSEGTLLNLKRSLESGGIS